jgi:beta-lactam-binding protein with PASTA domain
MLIAASSAAVAAEYQCTVNWKGPDGKTVVTVRVDSASEAAAIVDKKGHQVCKAAGHQRANDATLNSSQCSKI